MLENALSLNSDRINLWYSYKFLILCIQIYHSYLWFKLLSKLTFSLLWLAEFQHRSRPVIWRSSPDHSDYDYPNMRKYIFLLILPPVWISLVISFLPKNFNISTSCFRNKRLKKKRKNLVLGPRRIFYFANTLEKLHTNSLIQKYARTHTVFY